MHSASTPTRIWAYGTEQENNHRWRPLGLRKNSRLYHGNHGYFPRFRVKFLTTSGKTSLVSEILADFSCLLFTEITHVSHHFSHYTVNQIINDSYLAKSSWNIVSSSQELAKKKTMSKTSIVRTKKITFYWWQKTCQKLNKIWQNWYQTKANNVKIDLPRHIAILSKHVAK